jgi:hypothetical protein
VLITLHLSISPILLATLSEISSASNSKSFILSSRGGNRESIQLTRDYDIISFLKKEKSVLDSETLTLFGNDPSPVGSLAPAVYLHVYVSDLSGSGGTLNSPWWAVLKQHTELHDLIEDAA